MSDWNLTKNQALARKAERAFERAQQAETGIAAEAQRSRDLTVRPAGRPSSPSLVQILVSRFRLWLTRAPRRPGWQMTGRGEEIVVLGETEDSKLSGLTIYWFREWKADAVPCRTPLERSLLSPLEMSQSPRHGPWEDVFDDGAVDESSGDRSGSRAA